MAGEANLGSGVFGPIGAALAVLLLGLGAVAAWIARHPLEWRGWPLVETLSRYLPARLDAIAARLSSLLGVSGTALAAGVAGLLVVGALATAFTDLLDDVLDGGGIVRFDEPITRWLAGHREVWLTKSLAAVSRLGNVDAQTIWLVAVCLLAAVLRRSWMPIVVGVAGGGGIAVLIVVAKTLVGRHRPPLPYAVMQVDGFSFPSGHATGAAAVGMVGAWVLCRWVVRRWAAQVSVWAVTVAMIGLIGFSRCYLGVHFVSDVLAGWLLGTAWASTVILLAGWWLRARSARQRPLVG